MTRKEQMAQRPEGWKETAELLQSGKITQAQACERLGITRGWLNILLDRDFPGRKSRKAEWGKALGKSNRKYTTYLQKHFSDYEICQMIKARGKCERCPMKSCKSGASFKGLGAKLVAKVPLKDTQNISEAT